MTADEIMRLRPRIRQFLQRFDDCFAHEGTRAHLTVYVQCQLSNLPRKSVEPIALELYDRARGNGLTFSWITFDEGYGGKPGFLSGLIGRGQRFVGEVPGSLTAWLESPPVTSRPYRKRGTGRPRKVPRLVSGSP